MRLNPLPSCLVPMVCLLTTATGVCPAAAPVVDGTLVGDELTYGTALSVQNTDTEFGDAQTGDPRFAFAGSELDQVFGTVVNGQLHLLITGNLESNFNKLEVFIDSVPGGVNRIDGAALPAAVDPFCCGGFGTTGGALQQLDGLTFDAAFEADRYLVFQNGEEFVGFLPTVFYALTAHYADLTNGTTGQNSAPGMQLNAFGSEPGLAQGELVDQLNNGCIGPDDPTCSPPEHEFAEPVDLIGDPLNLKNHRDLLNDIGLRMALDNSNTEGVVFGTGATTGNPQEVVTGIEFSIPLAEIGNPTGDIKVTAFINGALHDFASNQFAGDGVLQGNLGVLSDVDLATIAGDQFVTVPIPEPAGGFIGLCACAVLCFRTARVQRVTGPSVNRRQMISNGL